VIHDAAGAIQWFGSTDGPAEAMAAWPLPAGLALLVVEAPISDALSWRIEDGALVARGVISPSVSTARIAADGVAESVVSGLPDPCTVTVSRQAPGAALHEAARLVHGPAPLAGGVLTVTTTEPGRLLIDVAAGLAWVPLRLVIDAD